MARCYGRGGRGRARGRVPGRRWHDAERQAYGAPFGGYEGAGTAGRRPRAGGRRMATTKSGRGAGIGVGGVLVIIGIIVALAWSVLLGVIIALVGLIAFGGFVKGKWY